MKNPLFLFIFLIIGSRSYNQVIMHLQLPPGGIVLKDQLWNLSLVNPSDVGEYLQVEVQLVDASNNQRILTGISRQFYMPKGAKQLRQADLWPITYNVLNTSYGVDVSASGFLPIGIFNVCYSLLSSNHIGVERVGEECELIEVEPVSPPMLVLPGDQEEVETGRPLFTWAPPAPVSLFNRLNYDLSLVEVQRNQTPVDAISKNIPVLFMPDLSTTSLQYPFTLAELDTAKLYAWRVKAKNNNLTVANSETWSFRIARANNDEAPREDSHHYIKLKRDPDGSIFTCRGNLRFEYNNEINDTMAIIRLYDITSAKRRELQLRDNNIAVAYGLNLKEIALDENAGVVDRRIYMLELSNARNETWYLKFRYQKPR